MRGVGLYKTVRGQVVFQKWPKKQPVARTAGEAANRLTLASAARIAKYVDAYQQVFSSDLAKQTQLLPRDFIFIALFGRIGTFVRTDGTKIFSMAAMQDVSAVLDAIAQIKNSLLLRGDVFWEPLYPGDPHQVLSIQDDGSIGWADPAGGSSSRYFMAPPPLVTDTAGANYGGNAAAFTPIYTEGVTTLTGVKLYVVTPGTGHTIYPGLYEGTGTTHTLQGGALVAQGPTHALVQGINVLPFDSPVILPSAKFMWGGVVILGAGNVALGINTANPYERFFGQTTSTLPATAGANTGNQSQNASWWFY